MSTDRQKILIVDDKEANLFSLEQVLKETKTEIIRAQSGNEALVASLNHDFALAILDVQMPVMDGYELAEWLRSEDKTRQLPIIFISAVYSSDHHVFKGYNAGAVDFMVKPYNSEILFSKVKVFLQLDQQKALLKKSREKLARVNETLENRVRERTAELETAIDELTVEVGKRKQAEKKIRQAKKEWQEIFEAIGQMALILDRDHTIIQANRASLEHTGLTAEEILGKKCHTIFHDSDQPVNHCPVEKLMRSDNPGLTESEIEVSGKTFSTSCTPVFDSKGELEKIIHLTTDVTRQKQLKKELIQAQKMETIGTLAGGIAHDFNNILFPIVGHTEILFADMPEDSPFKKDLDKIYTGALRARDLVKQILTFARHEGGDLKLMKMQPIIKEALKMIRSTIPTTIKIVPDIDPECAAVVADPTQIHQIIMNLATNASHAMEETGGELTVTLKSVKLGEQDLFNADINPGKYACLTVADTGSGMDEELIQKIFEPFFTTKEKDKGTGMGLSVVHGIVKGMKGDIKVYSEPEKGTQFYMYLPAAETVKEEEQVIDKVHIQGGSEHILLLDDEKPIIDMELMMLERFGYKVTAYTKSLDALETFRKTPDTFDLVITDMTMPDISGDKLAAELTKIRPDIPVILCTGFSETMSEEKAQSIGINGFLLKPIVMKDLADKIREVLD